MSARRWRRRVAVLEGRAGARVDPRLRAYARAVIAFGGGTPSIAAAEALAWWLHSGGWRERG